MNGRGFVEPNPMVGCILVRDNQIIAEGYHAKYGQPHAEPTALANCMEDPRGATAYVTLEPCCHTNKQTPPCAPRLIQAGIKRVVIGCLDPNPDVNGKGVAMLQSAGVEVEIAPLGLNQIFLQLIAPFTLQQKYERPYVTLKWAQTADGKIAGHEGMRLQISSAQANRAVHQLRSRSDAIIVGINTVLIDNPSLTVRDVPPVRQPERIILDRKLRTPRNCQLIQTALQVPTVVVTSLSAPSNNFEPLVNQGVRVVWPPAEREDILQAALSAGKWVKKPYSHVLVEPGPTLARALFKSGLCDRLWVITSSTTINDQSAPKAEAVLDYFVQTARIELGPDTLIEYLNPNSPAYFANIPSADIELIDLSAR